MTSLIDANPSAGSHGVDAMTASEIDAHPDCDRIWATIEALKASFETNAEARESQLQQKMCIAAGAAVSATRDAFFKVISPEVHDQLFDHIEDRIVS